MGETFQELLFLEGKKRIDLKIMSATECEGYDNCGAPLFKTKFDAAASEGKGPIKVCMLYRHPEGGAYAHIEHQPYAMETGFYASFYINTTNTRPGKMLISRSALQGSNLLVTDRKDHVLFSLVPKPGGGFNIKDTQGHPQGSIAKNRNMYMIAFADMLVNTTLKHGIISALIANEFKP